LSAVKVFVLTHVCHEIVLLGDECRQVDGSDVGWQPSEGRRARRVIRLRTASKVLDGTQPTFTHVPPTVLRSTMTTRAPRRRASMAAPKAAPPEPMIARS
jgi:hypothetical protein